jgi:hypothetical protein
LRLAVNNVLERQSLALADVDRFVCHPGGTKVVTALERALSLPQGSLDHEREVLAAYGNMSAPTVFFVLERVLKQGLPPRAVLSALGPGFTVSLVTLKRRPMGVRRRTGLELMASDQTNAPERTSSHSRGRSLGIRSMLWQASKSLDPRLQLENKRGSRSMP